MRVWTVSFVLLFVLTQLYQWLEGVVPPFPVFIGAGALLAIASNAGKWTLLSASAPSASSAVPMMPKTQPEPVPAMPPKLEKTTGLAEGETPQLPAIKPYSGNPFFRESSISFTVRSPQPIQSEGSQESQ